MVSEVTEIGARLALKNRAEFSRETETAARDITKIGHAAQRAEREGTGAFHRLRTGITGAFGHIMRGAALVGGVAGIGGVTVALGEGVRAAMDYQKVQAQTGAVLRSTRGEAGVTAKQVRGLSEEISRYSGIADESVQSGANLLLTFTGIRNAAGKGNDVFNQTTKVMTDMSVALKENATSAAMQLGKALNDPIQGVSMLRRVGVSFTADQIKMIKSVTQTHGVMAGQKIMLKELQKEFGGSAKAAGDTFAGSLSKAKNMVHEFMRGLAMPLMKPFTAAVGWASEHVLPGFEHGMKFVAKAFSTFADGFKSGDVEPVHSFFGFIHTAAAELGNMWQVLRHGSNSVAPEAKDKFTKLAGSLRGGLISGVHAAVKIFHALWHFTTAYLIPSIKNIIDFLTPGALEAFKAVAGIVAGAVVTAFHILGPLLKDVTGFLKDHKTAITALAIPILTLVAGYKLYTATTKAWTAVTKAAKDAQALFNRVMAMNPYVRVALLIMGIAAAVIYAYKHSATFRRIVQGAFHAVERAAKAVWNWLKDNWPYLLAILMGPFGLAVGWIIKHWRTVTGFFKGIPGALKAVGQDIVNAITWPFKTAFNLIADFWNNTAGKLHFHIPHWVPKIGGDGFSMPTIPKLHNGGLVTQGGLVNMLPGEEVVALPTGSRVMPINAPASTAPLSNLTGGSDGPVVLQLVVDRKVLAEQTYQHTRDKVARR